MSQRKGGKGKRGSSAAAATNEDDTQRLREWIAERVRAGDPPRVGDVREAARLRGLAVSQKKVNEILREDPVYLFNLHQQKERLSSRKYRPVIATNLGYLHCDIGYFPLSKHYPTPSTYKSGFLICKDILSRFTYLIVLRKSRKADKIVAALETLEKLHEAAGHTHPILGISFDRERSVLSKKVQSYLRERGIKFTAFKNTKSKAKFAEGGIGLVRKLVA